MNNQTNSTTLELSVEELEKKRQAAWGAWRAERIRQKDLSVNPHGLWCAPSEGWPPENGEPLTKAA